VSRRRVAALLLALAAVIAAGCGRSDPERELRATIDAMARAIENREPAAFLEAMADDFSRESGAFGKQDAKRTLVAAILRNEKINVSAAVTEVRIDGDRAFARVRVVATGGAGLLPERGQTWDFESAWRRERGQWKVFNADWREGL
jgi:ketosteroid isomerase-like protein